MKNKTLATLFQVARNKDFQENFSQNMTASLIRNGQYVPVSVMEAVCTVEVEAETYEQACERTFSMCQDEQAYALGCNYSMSVGDVVNVEGEWYRLTGMGWDCITGEQGATGTILIKNKEDEAMANNNANATINNTTVQEEGTMKNVEIKVDFAGENNTPNGDADQALETGKQQVGKVWHWFRFKGAGIGQKGKKWRKDQQSNIENFTGGLGVILGALDLVGLKPLRKAIMLLFVKAQNGEITVSQLRDEITKMILDRIEFLDGLTDDASLKQCATLKAFTAKNGKEYGEKSIIELIIACLLWIIKRTFAKLKEFFGIPEDKMPAIVKFAWGLIRALFDIILSAGLIVFSIALPGISLVVAGAFKALAWILGWAKNLWEKAKNWFTGLFKKEAPSDETVSTEQTVVNAEEVVVEGFEDMDYDSEIDDIAAALA